MTSTFQIVRELGWDYFEKLAKQKVMQVQSSTDPPKKLALGERAVMADGNDYNLVQLKEAGQPVEVVYPAEGTPLSSARTPCSKSAPNPNAARLFQSWLHSRNAQQMLVRFCRASIRSHPLVNEKPGTQAVLNAKIKLMKDDPMPRVEAGRAAADQGALHAAVIPPLQRRSVPRARSRALAPTGACAPPPVEVYRLMTIASATRQQLARPAPQDRSVLADPDPVRRRACAC